MGLFSKKATLPEWTKGKLGAITKGQVIPVSDVKDEVFSMKMLGDGVAFVSEDGVVVSPCDGTITAVFPTNHAVGIESADGAEILIHIGIDTVKEGGKGFKGFVTEGDYIKRGQKLVSFNKKQLEQKGYDLSIPMIITNMDDVENLKMIHSGSTCTEDEVFAYHCK